MVHTDRYHGRYIAFENRLFVINTDPTLIPQHLAHAMNGPQAHSELWPKCYTLRFAKHAQHAEHVAMAAGHGPGSGLLEIISW